MTRTLAWLLLIGALFVFTAIAEPQTKASADIQVAQALASIPLNLRSLPEGASLLGHDGIQLLHTSGGSSINMQDWWLPNTAFSNAGQ